MARKVSFLAKGKVRKRVTFYTWNGERVSFVAKVPSKRRKRVTFYTK